MKNKRSKLTALALSVLMAVSTISSVTWADDLFSDGENESSFEEDGFTASVIDNEELDVTEEATPFEVEELLGTSGENGVQLEWYDEYAVVLGETDCTSHHGRGVYLDPKDNKYKIEAYEVGKYDEDPLIIFVNPTGVTKAATCQHPAYDEYTFTYRDSTYYPSIIRRIVCAE